MLQTTVSFITTSQTQGDAQETGCDMWPCNCAMLRHGAAALLCHAISSMAAIPDNRSQQQAFNTGPQQQEQLLTFQHSRLISADALYCLPSLLLPSYLYLPTVW